MIQNILCAHDFSPSSERALCYAADLARRTGATLHLTYVNEVALGPLVRGEPSPVSGEEEAADDLRDQLRERSGATLDAHGLDLEEGRVSYHVDRSGAVAPSLVTVAEDTDADLLVVGTQGQRGLRRAFVGSVAREVMRTASCPVLTTRALPETEAAADPEVERIVVPIDFSETSGAALRYAGSMASIYEVPVRLVHVIEPPTMPSVYGLEAPKVTSRSVQARAEQALEEWGRDLRDEGPEVSYVVRRGEPTAQILDVASAATDFLVMGTHGRAGIQRVVLGSVTEGVLSQAQGPVLSGRDFPADTLLH
jgi:nucleotide-binding universal stress UspA family protein